MPTTLEDFVAKLHTDGVESGRAAGERLLATAAQEADRVRLEAEAEAQELVRAAEAQARQLLGRAEAELRLAARDALLQLRATLTAGLEAVLKRGTLPLLNDPSILQELLTVLVREYAAADAAGELHIVMDVPEHLVERLELWSLRELAQSLAGGEARVDVRGLLSEAGVEYRVAGTSVDMTVAAVAAVLRDLVRPALWQVLDAAVAEQREAEQREAEQREAGRGAPVAAAAEPVAAAAEPAGAV
jgi:hypothetical protein